jgi:beta-lactam-binding protein with PASTA domain
MRVPDVTGLPLSQAQALLAAAGRSATLIRCEAPRRKTPEPQAPVLRVVRQRNLPGSMSELVVSGFEGRIEWDQPTY